MKTLFKVTDLKNMTQLESGEWVPARPLNAKSLLWRIKASMNVFKGKAVPVSWK